MEPRKVSLLSGAGGCEEVLPGQCGSKIQSANTSAEIVRNWRARGNCHAGHIQACIFTYYMTNWISFCRVLQFLLF